MADFNANLAAPDNATLWQAIKHIRFAMLVTQEDNGALTSRPMTAVQRDYDGVLWFFASVSQHPATVVAQRPAVNVSFADAPEQLYVSLSGQATVTQDRAKIAELINPSVEEWFPGGVDNPDIALIRIEVQHVGYWDTREHKGY